MLILAALRLRHHRRLPGPAAALLSPVLLPSGSNSFRLWRSLILEAELLLHLSPLPRGLGEGEKSIQTQLLLQPSNYTLLIAHPDKNLIVHREIINNLDEVTPKFLCKTGHIILA